MKKQEVIKLICEVGKIEYTFKGVSFQDWPHVKPTTKYGQMPFVRSTEDPSFELCQSIAIARFFAREAGLYPTNNVDAAYSDEYVNTVKDLTDAFYKAFFAPAETKEEEMKKYFSGPFQSILGALEKEVSSSGFMVHGDSMTWADLYVFDFLNGVGSLPGADLRDFPKLVALRDRIAENEQVKAYLDSDRNLRK